jgi:pSer/pThr/pTyr-binding forkhead associated (FHA) protein
MSWFEVQSPKRAVKIRLDAPFFVIGRGERIPVFHDDPSISREHAVVVIDRKGGVRVRDLGSRNGVLLNGKAIGRYAETDVRFGDRLTVGGTTLVLHEGEPPPKVAAPATEFRTDGTTAEEPEKPEAKPEPAPPPAAESAARAAEAAAEAAASAALAASAAEKARAAAEPEVQDLSSTQNRDGGEPPPELFSSDEEEPVELA